jgi:hypothetical protein
MEHLFNYFLRSKSNFRIIWDGKFHHSPSFVNIVIKISRKNAIKEKYIVEKMNQIKSYGVNLIQCVDINSNQFNSDYLIAFNLCGSKLKGSSAQHFINNSMLLINTWNHIHLCMSMSIDKCVILIKKPVCLNMSISSHLSFYKGKTIDKGKR